MLWEKGRNIVKRMITTEQIYTLPAERYLYKDTRAFVKTLSVVTGKGTTLGAIWLQENT